jgi:glycosyltransferase involved in cell wall biosynthesis
MAGAPAAEIEGAEELAREGVSIVLPAYNEDPNIEQVVASIRTAVEKVTANLEILVVNDGSKDRTGEVAEAMARKDPRIRAIHHPANRGYGAALRTGFAAASKGFCFHTDTDGQFDLSEFCRLVPLVPGADVVVGFRADRRDPIHRRVNARLYHLLLGALFGLHVRDVDCAFKLWRCRLLKDLALESDSIFISAEALIKAARRRSVIREVAVSHYPRAHGKQTGNSLGTLAHALRELLKLSPGIRKDGLRSR